MLPQLVDLTKLTAEARDNVKFLTTLERHFKNIAGGPLNGILDTLPPMMNALRMVRACVRACACVYSVLMHACMRVCARVCLCVYACVCLFACTLARAHVCMCAWAHSCTGREELPPPLPPRPHLNPPRPPPARQVWIISRHYSDDQRMGSLFQRIALAIGDRVEAAVDMSQIFRTPPQESLALLRACKSVLEHWFSTYMQARARAGACGCGRGRGRGRGHGCGYACTCVGVQARGSMRGT